MSSLVICGNELQSGAGTSTFQAPFSFTNHLQQPLRIPPNSEVAVQSLKIVKEGVLSVSPASNWFQYYGVKLTDAIPITLTTSAPIPTDLGIDRVQGLSADGVAEKIQVGLNKGVPNPETFGLSTCTTTRDAEGAFEGFRHEFKERGSASGVNVISQTWANSYEGSGGMSFNSASNTLTALSVADSGVYNVAIGTETPIALNQGEFIVDVSKTAGTSWCVGLTRSRALGLDPDYFNALDSSITRNRNLFGDFIVGAFQTDTNQRYLRVYHAVYDTTSANYDATTPMTMKEVAYYSGDGDLDAEYNWSTNFSSGRKFEKVKIIVENENIKVQLFEPNADPTKAGAYIDLVVAEGDKGTRFKPVADTCRALYPIVFQSNYQSSSEPRFLTIEKFSGRNVGMKYGTTDWWGYLQRNDYERQNGMEVDVRPYNDMGTATAHTYKGLSGGFLQDYNVVMIVEEDSTNKYPETKNANSSLLLGFEGESVVDTYTLSNASGLGYFDSSSAPDLKSTSALFVRLNNLNIRTYNANMSAYSKIIYSVPRFSTGTDKNVGSLFFESPEKTYVSLNNPDELILNTFNIDLVNEDETLATDLNGKSVCILHIRRSPSM